MGRPVVEHILVLAHDAVARTRSIDEDAIEKIVEIACQHRPRRPGQGVVDDAAALKIADQRRDALVLDFIGYEQTAGILLQLFGGNVSLN